MEDAEDVLVLVPQLVEAFAAARAESDKGHDALDRWRPASDEQSQAKAFFQAFRGAPEMHNENTFHMWISRRDQICRLNLLKLKPGDFAPDDLITVKPSTGLRKPFQVVLQANAYMDQMLALMGLTRQHFLCPETAPPIPEELMERNADSIAMLAQLVEDLLGVGSPMDN
jgi:hypothetical protein